MKKKIALIKIIIIPLTITTILLWSKISNAGSTERYPYNPPIISYDEDNTNSQIYSTYWIGQNFTTGNDYFNLNSFQLKLCKIGVPATTISCALKSVLGNSNPLPLNIQTASYNTASILSCSDGGSNEYKKNYYLFDIADFLLLPNTMYNITCACQSCTSSNYISWRYDNTGTYSGGFFVNSSDSGANWSIVENYDLNFRLYGNIEIPTPTTTTNVYITASSTIPTTTEVTNAEFGNLKYLVLLIILLVVFTIFDFVRRYFGKETR